MYKKPAITVAIPTFRREQELMDTINDVLVKQTVKNLELIVIDQTPEHTEKVQKQLAAIKDRRFRYYKTTPPSVTAARNFALNSAKAPYIIFLDDDVILDRNLVKEFLETFTENPDISAVAGRVLQAGFPIKKDVLRFDKYAISHGVFTATEPNYTNAFPGGNCALKVSDALSLGGFDTRYKGNAFREENDLSLRMANSGLRIYFNPRAVLTHLAAPYGGNRVKTHIYDNPGFYKNELFFTLRFAEKGCKIEALRIKYRDYCLSVRHKQAWIRRYYFYVGLVVAIWRIYFGKNFVSEELPK